jgi:hypothetical protein
MVTVEEREAVHGLEGEPRLSALAGDRASWARSGHGRQIVPPQADLYTRRPHEPAPSYGSARMPLASSRLAGPYRAPALWENRMIKRNFLQGLLAVSFGGWLSASEAQVVIRVAPPPPREERMPPPRRNMVWVAGYWDWNGRRHVWREGHWVKARHGYRYREDKWVERNGGWMRERGGWDRDGDGVPNRMDSRPNNPNKS